jgi:hypothetical protein
VFVEAFDRLVVAERRAAARTAADPTRALARLLGLVDLLLGRRLRFGFGLALFFDCFCSTGSAFCSSAFSTTGGGGGGLGRSSTSFARRFRHFLHLRRSLGAGKSDHERNTIIARPRLIGLAKLVSCLSSSTRSS